MNLLNRYFKYRDNHPHQMIFIVLLLLSVILGIAGKMEEADRIKQQELIAESK